MDYICIYFIYGIIALFITRVGGLHYHHNPGSLLYPPLFFLPLLYYSQAQSPTQPLQARPDTHF